MTVSYVANIHITDINHIKIFKVLDAVLLMAKMSLNNIPLDWVRAFEMAGRTGSFTAAAQRINVTQASISQRISSLEQRIGSQLFIRNARGVSLSVEGEAWLPYVSAAFRSLEESYEDIFGIQREKLPFRQALLSMNCGCLLGFVIGKTKTANRSHCLQLFYKQNLACWILQSIYNTVRGKVKTPIKVRYFQNK